MTTTKTERLGAEKIAYIAREYFVAENESKLIDFQNAVESVIREAEDGLRKEMELEKSEATGRIISEMGRSWKQVLENQQQELTQAVEKAVLEEREAACADECWLCGHDEPPVYEYCMNVMTWVHHGPEALKDIGTICAAAHIRRRGEEGK